jgi:hypothetical protein
MLPALSRFFLASAACLVAHLFAISAFTQDPAKLLRTDGVVLRPANDAVAEPSLEELKSLGAQGQVIQQARAEVLLILTGENACSAWYRNAEPEAAEKFRSLRFAVDLAGAGEILKKADWREDPFYYQPYVARTGQNVGWGSTITVNGNGAFFRSQASVRIVDTATDAGYFKSFRPLLVGGFRGATLEARVLTILHEYGHILDMIPIDVGGPSAPIVSMHNTETVLRHCKPQIQAAAKHSHGNSGAAFAKQLPPVLHAEPIHRDGWKLSSSSLPF